MKKMCISKILATWSKKILLGIMITAMGMSTIACQESRQNHAVDEIEINEDIRQLEYDLAEPLVVFYEEDSGILQNFINMYPEIKIELHHIGWGGLDSQYLEEYIYEHGEPDIILARNIETGYNMRFEYWYQDGLIQDLREFYINDDSIIESEYVPSTFQVLDNGEGLLGLPLSWESRCLIIQDSKWEDSELSYLPENYTGKELYTALLHEAKRNREDGEFFWAYNYDFLMDDLYEMDAVKEDENGEVFIDEELFKLLYEYHIQRELASTGGANQRYKAQSHPALDPEALDGRYYGSTLDGAPQVNAVYANSVAKHNRENIHTYWIPTAEDEAAYVGDVRNIAFVGANSARKQQAYDVIRLMMDMPITIIIEPSGNNDPSTFCPVNINRALQMLEYLDDGEENLVIKNLKGMMVDSIEKEKLSKDEKQKVVDVITGVVDLQFQFDATEVYSICSSYVDSYKEGDDINHRQCYFEVMKSLNPESEKWNLTQEEIKAFVEQTE